MEQMTQDVELVFQPGDWIVHRDYGAGQIIGVETKELAGVAKRYYAIEAAQLMLWVPLDQHAGTLLRPLAQPARLREVLAVLEAPAEPLPDHNGARTRYLRAISLLENPVKIARAVRALWALRKRRSGLLSSSDRYDWQRLLGGLASEWSAWQGVALAEARAQIEGRLRRARAAQPALD